MIESEIIVFVEKDRKERYTCALTTVDLLKKSFVNGKVKIVYYEIFTNNRTARSRLKKMQSLSKIELAELIKGSNPEMLNLINCI
jgi:hypothetical protein